MLGLDSDDTLTLWPEALGGLGLYLELVGNVLAEAWHCQPALGAVAIHQERGGWLWAGKMPLASGAPSPRPRPPLTLGWAAPPPWAISQVTR